MSDLQPAVLAQFIATGNLDAYTAGRDVKKAGLGDAFAEAVGLALTAMPKLFKAFLAGFNEQPEPTPEPTPEPGPKVYQPGTIGGTFKPLPPKTILIGGKKIEVLHGIDGDPHTGVTIINAILAKKVKAAKKKSAFAVHNKKWAAKGMPWLQLVAEISKLPATSTDPHYAGQTKEGSLTKITKQEDFVAASTAGEPAVLESLTGGKIGQRVAGTNPGAIYYLIAVLDGLNVAMRWKGAQLSVRISGPKLAEYTERLKAAGIYANHTTYFSAHLGQQGAVEGPGASLSAQMLYASVLASIAGDVANFTERAPYEWRNWLTPAAAPTTEAAGTQGA